jgi:RsiW-degrading membrane proteinase PrsW (M82 family)
MFNSSDVDEPIDIMLFVIISALGFAAMENIMVLHNQSFQAALTASDVLITIGWRFVSATFLHALCSGVVGFFLAWSIYKGRRNYRYIALGLLTAIILHGIYNWAIMEGGSRIKIIVPAAILLLLSAVVAYGFQKLKSIKSTCLIKTF